MSQASVLEPLIEVASRLKESVADLYHAYTRMPEIISREERAIAAGDFVEVRDTCEEKAVVCGRIEALFSSMTKAGDKIHQLSQSVLAPARERPLNLSEHLQLLLDLSAHFGNEAFAAQVLAHVCNGLAEQVAQFFVLYTKVKPQIEANRYLVGKMMVSFQQSYRFWQEVSEQIAVSYNAHGVQQAAGHNHGFRVRA